MVPVVENGMILKGGVLAGGGAAALASDNTNVLLSSTRMDALGLTAGMSYARNWVGKVGWYIGNTGVINNFRRMHRWVASDWSKAGDRDVNSYIDVMRQQVKGEWTVHHQLGHMEKRKKYWWKDPWTMAEWGTIGSLMELLDARGRWQRWRRKSGWRRWTNGMRRWIGESGWAA
jgi:hypothetical protein